MPKLLALLGRRPYGFALAFAIALFVANVLVRPSFAESSSWPSTLAAFAPFALAAIASTPSVLSGGGSIDVSIGPLLNLVCVVVVAVLIPHGITSAWLVIPIAAGLGAAVGIINGLLVAVGRYQAVLATLCALFVLQGVSLRLLEQPTSGSTPWLADLGGKVGPVPGALILLAVPFIIWAALRRTAYVRSLSAVGGDHVASFAAGVNVAAVRVIAFGLGGLFAGLAGIALAAVTQSADASQGLLYTLPAIAAVAIGGTSLLGGRGSLLGSAAGAAIMFLIQTLLDSLAVPSAWLQVVYGSLLLAAIVSAAALTGGRARAAT